MKRISKAKKLHKLIALWIVFVMLMTPLFEHVGPRNGAKADEPPEPPVNNDVPEVAGTIEISGSGDMTTEEKDTVLYIYTNKPDSVPEITVWTAGNNAKFKLRNAVSTTTGVVGSNPQVESLSGKDSDLYYIISDTDTDTDYVLYETNTLDDLTSYTSDAYIQADKDKVIYVYSKLQGDTIIITSGNPATEYKTAYVLQAKITVEDLGAIASSASWKNGSEVITKAKEASVVGADLLNNKVTDATINKYVAGTIKYGYAASAYDTENSNALKTEYSDYITVDSSSVNWDASATVNTDGKYIGFVGYFASSLSTKPIEITVAETTTYKVVSTGAEVLIDNTAPVVRCEGLEVTTDNGTSWTAISSSDNPYTTYTTKVGNNIKYRYKLTINDNAGVGLSDTESDVISVYDANQTTLTSFNDATVSKETVQINGVDTTYYYITIASDKIAAYSASNPTKLAFIAKDKLGNKTDSDNTTPDVSDPTALTPSLKQVLTGVEIKASLVDDSGNEVKDIEDVIILSNAVISDPAFATINNILKKTAASYKIKITATSDVAFTNIQVQYQSKTGSNNETKTLSDSAHTYSTTEEADHRYKDELTFDIPADVSVSEVLESIKVNYTLADSSSASKAIGKLVYDATAPTIEAVPGVSKYLQESSNGGTSWTAVTINNGNTDAEGVYYTDPNKKYRYIIKVTDPSIAGSNGSGVDEVYIDSSRKFTEITDASTNIPVTGTPTGIFAYEITADLENYASLSDTVYASDKSGNATATGFEMPKLRQTDESLKIEAQVKKPDGSVVSTADLPKYTKLTGYKLVVTVSSGFKVKEIKLNKKNATADSSVTELMLADDDSFDYNSFDSIFNRYTAIAEFDLSAVDNEWFKDMYITAKDTAATPQTKRFPETEDTYLSDVLYDISAPYEVSSSGSQNSWLKENAFTFEYSSGNKTGIESPIKSIDYEVTNIAANTSGSITVDGISTVVSNSGSPYNVPESTSLDGTKLTYTVTDAAGNTSSFTYNIKIDKTQPDIELFANNVKSFDNPLMNAPTIKAVYGDNLTIKTVKLTIAGPNGTVEKVIPDSAIEELNVNRSNSYSLASLYGTVADGKYTVTAYIEDKAGNSRNASAISFTMDSTKADISSSITEGTKSPKTGNYYSSNVGVYFTYKDASTVKPVIKDNNSLVGVDWKKNDDGSYSGYMIVNTEGAHKIAYAVTDAAGNVSNAQDIEFVIDKTSPVISTSLNNVSYNESKGMVYLTNNANVAISVSDANEDKGDLNYRVTLTKPDKDAVTSQYQKTESRSLSYTEEGEYKVELYAVDKANNKSENRSVSFRVDKTAPALTITGANATTTNAQTTVSFSMNESFWWDASGTITVYRKAGDGIAERQIDTIEFKPTAKSTTITRSYSETGVYRFEFEANDKAGHTSSASGTLTIDANKPTLDITALETDGSKKDVTNYSVTNQTVSFYAEMSDEFYANKVIKFTGTRTDIDGKVHNIDVSVMGAKSNPSTITQDFDEDGTYDITITVTDIVGNEVTKSLHFTIDKTAPVIGDLSKYEGTKKSFEWDEDLEQLVSDLTVCDVHVYLNGREYDGTSDIEDGAYTLLVTAQDEINDMVEKSVEFVLDTKAPSFIVTGVEDGEVKDEDYNINVSLQLDEDKLTSVTLNGQVVTITNNVASLTVNSKGEYTLHAEAIDEAGNESSIDISFTYGKKTNSLLWIIIIAAGVIVLGGIIFVIVKKSKKNN